MAYGEEALTTGLPSQGLPTILEQAKLAPTLHPASAVPISCSKAQLADSLPVPVPCLDVTLVSLPTEIKQDPTQYCPPPPLFCFIFHTAPSPPDTEACVCGQSLPSTNGLGTLHCPRTEGGTVTLWREGLREPHKKDGTRGQGPDHGDVAKRVEEKRSKEEYLRSTKAKRPTH